MRTGNSQPGADQLLFDRAVFSLQSGELAQAERGFRALLTKQPKHPGALNLLGVLLTRLGRFAEAEPYIRQATGVTSGSDATFYNYGIVLKSLNRPLEALDAFSRALTLNADVAETWNNRGTVLNGLGHHDEAISDFARATSLKPGYAEAFCNKGKPLIETRRYAEALSAYDTALKLDPDLAEAWQGRGNVLAAQGRQEEALAALDAALKLRPDGAEMWKGRGELLMTLGRYDEAISAFASALHADPDIEDVPGDLMHAKAHVCDWHGMARDWSRIIEGVRNGARVSRPFAFLAGPASAADQLKCSRIYAANRIPPSATQLWCGERTSHDRLRIAYLSADFRQHAVSQVAAGMFEHHDRARFETCAISYGVDDGSAMRARLSRAFDRFIDVRQKSDPEIASLIRELEIDIVIDLTGYTAGMRANVLVQRPAPLQVNYLGYPGSMGADFIDYIVADRFLIPPDLQCFYAEKIAYLDCYQAGDPQRVIAEPGPTRAD